MRIAIGSGRAAALFLAILSAVAAVAYWPGLSGGFLFDDFANLPALSRYGPVQDLSGLLRYVTSGIADPTGRPVSLLSFLIDAHSWPADPYPFKRTNLVLHIINGWLLYAVLASLGKSLGLDNSRMRYAALFGAAVWMLHPLWVSTVLYAIQRQAILAATFVLLGLRAWIASRAAFERGDVRQGWCWAIVAVPVCGLLAGLSKANGFLLPLLLLCLEASVLRAAGASDADPAAPARRVFVLLPAALVIAAIAYMASHATDLGMHRDWSIAQRALTQPRTLFDYLCLLALPGLRLSSVFTDAFAVSTGWLQPWSTLPAALGVAALAALAWHLRRRSSAASAAILFFLAGHAMESTFIPLELYYEHRNYLPAVLAFWPLGLWLASSRGRVSGKRIAAVVIVMWCALATYSQAKLWGDTVALARAWASAMPHSARAQTFAASTDIAQGRPADAIARLAPLSAAEPGELQYALTLLQAQCVAGRVDAAALRGAEMALHEHGLASDLAHRWLADALAPDRHASCATLPYSALSRLVDAATTHPPAADAGREVPSRAERLFALRALLLRDCAAALRHYDRRLDLQRRAEFAHEQIGSLATYCGARYGLAHLDHYLAAGGEGDAPMSSPMLRLRDRILDRQGYWQAEWTRLRKLLLDETDVPHGRSDRASGAGTTLAEAKPSTADQEERKIGDRGENAQ